MDENNIDAKISVKTTQLQVEKNPIKLAEYQRDLEILNLRKQIQVLRDKIEFKQRNR
jgi:hypothetical protein